MKNTRTLALTTSAAAVAMLMTGTVAFAETTQTMGQGSQGWGHMGRGTGMRAERPGVAGTVTGVSGNTITIESRGFGPNTSATPTTYTIDAAQAKIEKDGNVSNIGAIAVGDMIRAEGTVTGTQVAATEIHDGMPRGGMMGGKDRQRRWDKNASSTIPRMGMMGAALAGNGQPILGGTVSVVSGNSVTITNNKGGSTYVIDATNATVMKSGATSTIAAIQVGDAILAQGAINGTTMTASSIIDHGAMGQPIVAQPTGTNAPRGMMGFFGGIGGFFRGLFGF